MGVVGAGRDRRHCFLPLRHLTPSQLSVSSNQRCVTQQLILHGGDNINIQCTSHYKREMPPP